MGLDSHGYEARYLRDGSLVRFYLTGSKAYGERFYVEVRVDRRDHSKLQIMGYSAIRLLPGSSNVVEIEAAR